MKAKNKLWEWCLRLEHHLCPDFLWSGGSPQGNRLRPLVTDRDIDHSLSFHFILHNGCVDRLFL